MQSFLIHGFFGIASSVADATANVIKTLLGIGASTLFINGKPAVINALRKSRNPPTRLIILLLVPFKKIPLFSKNLITL